MRDADLKSLLHSAFGYSSFRSNQEAVGRAVIEGRDVLLVMPTGSGKSTLLRTLNRMNDNVADYYRTGDVLLGGRSHPEPAGEGGQRGRGGAVGGSRRRAPGGEEAPPAPHIWRTLGYRGIEQADGVSVIEWDATPEFCFHVPSGPIVHGGMVTTLLDTAMGGACWSLMAEDEDFLTADLRTEFMRSARPGTLRAEGQVVQRSRRVVFCSAELYDSDGTLLATARCTQIVRRPRR